MQVFIDCVRKDIPPPVTGHDARATLAVGLAATQAMHVGRPIDLTMVD